MVKCGEESEAFIPVFNLMVGCKFSLSGVERAPPGKFMCLGGGQREKRSFTSTALNGKAASGESLKRRKTDPGCHPEFIEHRGVRNQKVVKEVGQELDDER